MGTILSGLDGMRRHLARRRVTPQAGIGSPLMKEAKPRAARKRVRLKPEVRSQQILDAALAEFSRHGFAAARIEDIATAVGLSKGGIYQHFASKERIFEALLMTILTPLQMPEGVWLPDKDMPLDAVIEAYLDQLYAALSNPVTIATLRLMISESERVPDLIRRWHEQVVKPHHAQEQAIIDAFVERGVMRDCTLTQHFFLAVAPALLWAIKLMLVGNTAPLTISQTREVHKQLLMDIVRPH